MPALYVDQVDDAHVLIQNVVRDGKEINAIPELSYEIHYSNFSFYVVATDRNVNNYTMSSPIVTAVNTYIPGGPTAAYSVNGSAMNGGLVSANNYINLRLQYEYVLVVPVKQD